MLSVKPAPELRTVIQKDTGLSQRIFLANFPAIRNGFADQGTMLCRGSLTWDPRRRQRHAIGHIAAAAGATEAGAEHLDRRIEEADGLINKTARESEACRRLDAIPGIGPITATAMIAATLVSAPSTSYFPPLRLTTAITAALDVALSKGTFRLIDAIPVSSPNASPMPLPRDLFPATLEAEETGSGK